MARRQTGTFHNFKVGDKVRVIPSIATWTGIEDTGEVIDAESLDGYIMVRSPDHLVGYLPEEIEKVYYWWKA